MFYLTVFLFLALFSWFQSRRPFVAAQSRNFWAQAIIMYCLVGLRITKAPSLTRLAPTIAIA